MTPSTDKKNTASVSVTTQAERNPDPIIDQASASVRYVGYAPLGTPQTSANWMIKRVTTTGTVTITEYANGEMTFRTAWSARATAQYSR
jgi:hypothetical protein